MVLVCGPGNIGDVVADISAEAAQSVAFDEGHHVIFQIMKVLVH